MKKQEPTLGIISEQINLLSKKMSRQFNSVENKLVEHDERFNSVDNRLSEHDKRFSSIDNKLVEHDERFDQLDAKTDSLAIITNKHFISHDSRLRKVEYLTAS